MRQVWSKLAAFGLLTFLGLWVTGLLGNLALPSGGRVSGPAHVAVNSQQLENASTRRQFANNLAALGLTRAPIRAVLDDADIERIRVHEKTGRLGTTSSDIVSDEAKVRAALEACKGGVFNETSSGIAPERRLTLEVGVAPDKFDALIDQLKQIGRPETFLVQDQDRTGELRHLHARRQSLKKHLEAVRKLSARDNPTIDDSLKLAQRGQEIERELELLSVQVGDFLGKESLYSVTVTLAEDSGGTRLLRRATRALLWAASWWAASALSVGLLIGAGISVRVLIRPAVPAPAAPASSGQREVLGEAENGR
jgi:hypothetical protein